MRHLNAAHKGQTTKDMMNKILSSRTICVCGHIDPASGTCSKCKRKMDVYVKHIEESSKISPLNQQPTQPSHIGIILPDLDEDTFHELLSKPLPTNPKLTVNSSTWRRFGLALREALRLADAGNW